MISPTSQVIPGNHITFAITSLVVHVHSRISYVVDSANTTAKQDLVDRPAEPEQLATRMGRRWPFSLLKNFDNAGMLAARLLVVNAKNSRSFCCCYLGQQSLVHMSSRCITGSTCCNNSGRNYARQKHVYAGRVIFS